MLDLFRGKAHPALGVMALEQQRTNLMIADADLNIIFINPSVVALLREAEADLKQELPNFAVSTLIGSNIDVFHKHPVHQRRMLGALDKRHETTIWIGQRGFDLVVNPLFSSGRRIGFVVEWGDARARLLNLDYAAQIAAISRSQAVIEFATDGTVLHANENFLRAVGYRLDEVKNQHHSMFVDAEHSRSDEYKAFWDRLRAGTYQSGKYRRLGKNGNIVWVEGAYNPIRDQSGKVCKIVKFASDITAQMDLLANLKLLIDHNFGEIGTAIGASSDEAGLATAAAGTMSASMQSVAASAEELAASIAEIAHSMVQSRSATESAFDQTVAAGHNTETLARSAQAMNGIVGLIRNVASQINLLALNATIEAARAGDAGKGFAVVATEVKTLAIQAATATQQISTEIDGIQKISVEVAGALNTIRAGMTTVRESVMLTASAVEQQNAVTRGMSTEMRSASDAVNKVSGNITGISAAVAQVAAAVGKTRQAAQVLVVQ